MKILVVGPGAREHAIAWKLSQSSKITKIFVAPGNAGTAREFENVPIPVNDLASLADFAEAQAIDLTVVGPESPLVAGIAEEFQKRSLPLVGPSRNAARLEGSKVFAKEFMSRHKIPTARYATVESYDQAINQIAREWRFPLVVKADGLAAGKGVFVCASEREAVDALEAIFKKRQFGSAGDRVVLEEFVTGREASYMVFTDGRNIAPVVASQDYKRAYDGDAGPNTGGMGAVSVPGLIEEALERQILSQIIQPTLRAMESEGFPFQGALYAGLMITNEGPRVLEFNVRLGDPETEVILPRLQSDFADLLLSVADRTLQEQVLEWSMRSAVCVVLASGGYPGEYQTGKIISGLEMSSDMDNIKVFHAGTALRDGRVVTAGGRVLMISATAGSLPEAVLRAYEAVNAIQFEGMRYRSDIGAGLEISA
jgi:phosphoribosylamine--glycine ligase